jgi:hypothetical protein
MVFQSAQVALAMGASSELDPALAGMISDLAYAMSVIAYVPMGVMLAAVAVVSLRIGALPAWVGWLSLVNAAMNLCLSLGIVVDRGPLAPGGVLTYVLYGLTALWLLAMTTVMVVQLGKPASAWALPEVKEELQGRAGRRPSW